MFIALLCILAVFGWYCYSLGRGSVHSNGAGAAAITGQLNSAGETASSITERIEDASKRESAIRERLDRVESIVADSGDAIKDSQRILAGIRQRGKKEIK